MHWKGLSKGRAAAERPAHAAARPRADGARRGGRGRRSGRRRRPRLVERSALWPPPDLQLAAWPCLVHLIEAQPFLRKALADLDALRLVLSAIDAHKGDEGVLTQLAIATRLLLPATPPRAFVEAGGLELLVEAIAHHPSCLVLAEVAGGCLLKLAGVNNIVRRMLLRMEVSRYSSTSAASTSSATSAPPWPSPPSSRAATPRAASSSPCSSLRRRSCRC